MENVIEESVLLVPEAHPRASPIVHGVSDLDEVLEELGSDALVSRILARQLQSDGEHIQTEHPHIVESQEAPLKHVHAFSVFPIHPPREVQEELVECAFEKFSIGPPRPL